MRSIRAVFMALLLTLIPLLLADQGVAEIERPDAVWAGWTQDMGPPVVVVSDTMQMAVLSTALAQQMSVISPPADVRSDNLEVRLLVETPADIHKLTPSLSDGTTASERMVNSPWRVGESLAR